LTQVYEPLSGKFTIIPKTYGRAIKATELPEGIAKFFPLTSVKDKPVLLAVLDGIIAQVEEIAAVFRKLEIRMVGGSLLMVWEGDEIALKHSLEERQKDHRHAAFARERERSDGGSEDDTSEHDEGKNRTSPAYTVKIIDFVHTRMTPGSIGGEGVQLGLETVLKLLKGRKAELS